MDFENGQFFLGEAAELDQPTVEALRLALNNIVENNRDALSVSLVANGYRVDCERANYTERFWDSKISVRPQPEYSFGDGLFLTAKERRLLNTPSGYIPAIKSIRQRMNLGLKEAKDHIDLFRREYDFGRVGSPDPCPHSAGYVLYGQCRRCGQPATEGCVHPPGEARLLV